VGLFIKSVKSLFIFIEFRKKNLKQGIDQMKFVELLAMKI